MQLKNTFSSGSMSKVILEPKLTHDKSPHKNKSPQKLKHKYGIKLTWKGITNRFFKGWIKLYSFGNFIWTSCAFIWESLRQFHNLFVICDPSSYDHFFVGFCPVHICSVTKQEALSNYSELTWLNYNGCDCDIIIRKKL